MEFNVHADDDDFLVCKPSDGPLSSQALSDGIIGGAAMHSIPPPLSDRESFTRQIVKQQIREEILAKEMAERRILEEEVRREIEIERIMEIRRLHMERFSILVRNDAIVHGDPRRQQLMPSWSHSTRGALLRQEFVHDAAEFAFRERSPSRLLQKRPITFSPQSSQHNKVEKCSQLEETTALNCTFPRATKKACGESRLPAKKQWGCAICEVSSTSEQCLKTHLQGKKHKTKEASLSSKTTVLSQSKNTTLQSKGASASGPANKKQPPMKGTSSGRPGRTQQKFWCFLCKVKCNSPKILENHYNGKRHKAFEELKKGKGLEGEAAKEGANAKPCADTEAEGFVKEDEAIEKEV